MNIYTTVDERSLKAEHSENASGGSDLTIASVRSNGLKMNQIFLLPSTAIVTSGLFIRFNMTARPFKKFNQVLLRACKQYKLGLVDRCEPFKTGYYPVYINFSNKQFGLY